MRTCLVLSSPVLRPLLPLAEPFQARVAETVEELMDLLRGAPPSAVVLLAPGEDCPPARVGWIVAAAGVVPVVAAMELVAAQAETAAALWRAGISDMVDLRPPPVPEGLAAELADVHARPFRARVEAALPPRMSIDALSLLRAAAGVVVAGGIAADLATLLDARERTLLGWCRREHLPPPRRLLVWLRLALAAALLETQGRSIVSAARGAGYSGDHSLRRALGEELGPAYGSNPRTLVFAQVMERFSDELRALREDAPARGGRRAA